MVSDLVNSKPLLEGRGETYCRGCLGENLFSGLDLGELPIANELLFNAGSKIEKFPLHLRICSDCGLGQVADVVTPDRIFRDYRYLSSMSSTFLKHASDFVAQQLEVTSFLPGDWVLEIASNDGYLLRNFLPHGIRAVGIEPAENVAELSRRLGIEVISEFFSRELASELVTQNGFPKLIIANNVMAHVPDLVDFIKGLAILCGPDTRISVENPALSSILLGMQFDTVYHEHYSYLSASSIQTLSKMYGLNLCQVEELQIHGGSNRYWLHKLKEDNFTHESVQRIINYEKDNGLFNSDVWITYTEKVKNILSSFLLWLRSTKENKGKIYGYGAAAKASTLLNVIDLEVDFISGIADISLEKQNRFMPPNGIQIISPTELASAEPTDVVIFPWNIKTEIATHLRVILPLQTRLWCVIPFMHEVEI